MATGGIKGYLVEAVRTAGRSLDFRGRSTRSELLTYYFSSVLIGLVLGIALFPFLEPEQEQVASRVLAWVLNAPILALLVRRLHDQDRSGSWAWLLAFPVGYTAASDLVSTFGGVEQRLGYDRFTWILYWPSLACTILMLIAAFLPGTVGSNRFGPDPRGRE